MNIKIN